MSVDGGSCLSAFWRFESKQKSRQAIIYATDNPI